MKKTVFRVAWLLAGVALASPAWAADRSVTVALDFSLTGADADGATRMKDGAVLAIEQANAAGGVAGYRIEPMILDDGTATAGQYDPGQAATNARKMVGDPSVVAAIGPQMSGAGKAMAPVLNEGGLAMITPSASNGDITSVRFAEEYRASGKLTFFRTVATDAFQGPAIANYFAEVLHVKSVYVLDDTGAYGVGIANAFAAQAARKGIKLLGRDKVDPKAADYSAVMTKIRALNPDALYFGGVFEAGLKVIKQSFDAIPKAAKGGGDGIYGPEMLLAAGFPAAEGWYVTIGAPHGLQSAAAAAFRAGFVKRFGIGPDDFAMTAFDAAQVVLGAIRTVAAAGKPVTRDTVREAIVASRTGTLQGDVQFDPNGDLKVKTISIFRVTKDAAKPLDDMDAQLRYVGVAPQN